MKILKYIHTTDSSIYDDFFKNKCETINTTDENKSTGISKVWLIRCDSPQSSNDMNLIYKTTEKA